MIKLGAAVAPTALLLLGSPLVAQRSYYVGVLAGISTLSADGRSTFAPSVTSTSLYKPENGPLLNLFAGIHLSDYVTIQANYVWNRNEVTMVSLIAPDRDGPTSYEQARTSRQQGAFGDLLFYFRNLGSRVRPYLSAGTGVVVLHSEQSQLLQLSGVTDLSPPAFSAAKAAFRAGVGVDLSLGNSLQFRYSFVETIQGNEFSRHLSPPGARNLAHFQNLFGIAVRFHRF